MCAARLCARARRNRQGRFAPGWFFACRTAKNVLLFEDNGEQSFQSTDLLVEPSQLLHYPVAFTAARWFSVTAIAVWEPAYTSPLYLVTNLALAAEAVHWYKRRLRIETFFSPQKSRGFHLHKSHLRCLERLSRLLITCYIDCIWIVFLGAAVASRPALMRQVHRSKRRDLSLFQLGLVWLERCLNAS